jgi:F0F1-type ATP synthase membrane subunit c/vacuolar-type H+-ATPase subunit K
MKRWTAVLAGLAMALALPGAAYADLSPFPRNGGLTPQETRQFTVGFAVVVVIVALAIAALVYLIRKSGRGPDGQLPPVPSASPESDQDIQQEVHR